MDGKAAAKKGAGRVKELAEHVERLTANVITGGTAEHLSKAGNEMLTAINKTMGDMSIPEDTKKHLLTAEREALLAVKGVIDAVIKEIDRMDGGRKPSEKLKKIKIK
jgi:hypothetical protein